MSAPNITLLNGDCCELLDDLEDNSIDVLYTDAPYIPPEHSKTLTKYRKTLSEMGILESFYKQFIKKIDRVLKDDGIVILFCNCDSYPMFYIHLYPYVKKMRCFIWDKISCSLGYTFRHQHEMLLCGERPNMTPIKCGTGDVFKYKVVRAKDKDHPAQKPVDLHTHILSNIVKKRAEAGGNTVVLDPFMGTGSIGLSCKELGCDYVGMELEKDFYDKACAKFDDMA
jgi:site-specific DNA-methyltransferase (adenine-specific)